MREHEFFETHTMIPSARTGASSPVTYLRALLERSPIATVVLDAHQRYTMSNPAFERLFQYTSKELAAADLDELIAGPAMVEEARRLSCLTLQGQHVHTVTQRRRRDAMMVDVEIYGIPLMVEDELVGVYGLYQDVTDRNKAQTAFREISDQLEHLQQEERRRLARDLHDSTAQELTVLNWNLSRLMSLVGEGDATLKNLVQETRELAYQCSTRIRSASYLLHPPLLGDGGLTVAISRLVDGFEERSGIVVTLAISKDLGRFRDEIEVAIFRIVQEGLTNVMRHSGSPVVTIRLHFKDDWLQLTVSDEGKGHAREVLLQARDSHSGVGLSGMQERAEQVGGCLQIHRTDDGTTLIASIPTGTGSTGPTGVGPHG